MTAKVKTYDEASTMMGKHIGVSTKIIVEQPKAIKKYCQGHSSRLVLKSMSKNSEILQYI